LILVIQELTTNGTELFYCFRAAVWSTSLRHNIIANFPVSGCILIL